MCLRETRLSHVPWITHAALRAVETEEGRASVAAPGSRPRALAGLCLRPRFLAQLLWASRPGVLPTALDQEAVRTEKDTRRDRQKDTEVGRETTQSCPTLCDSTGWSMPGFPVHFPGCL